MCIACGAVMAENKIRRDENGRLRAQVELAKKRLHAEDHNLFGIEPVGYPGRQMLSAKEEFRKSVEEKP